ncbi:MAG: hypothetical protein C4292_00170, partial [Nitrososphaera sp.]
MMAIWGTEDKTVALFYFSLFSQGQGQKKAFFAISAYEVYIQKMRKTLPLPLLLLSARFRRHEQTLLIASALSIALLSMLYALTSTAAT